MGTNPFHLCLPKSIRWVVYVTKFVSMDEQEYSSGLHLSFFVCGWVFSFRYPNRGDYVADLCAAFLIRRCARLGGFLQPTLSFLSFLTVDGQKADKVLKVTFTMCFVVTCLPFSWIGVVICVSLLILVSFRLVCLVCYVIVGCNFYY